MSRVDTFTYVSLPPNQVLQRAALPGSWTVRESLVATVVAARAFPAAVTELGR
jgi:hypothetical protein